VNEKRMQSTERKRGSERSGCEARKMRPKRKRICKEQIYWEKLKLDAEIWDLLSSDTNQDNL
jgi:hypothetical protein